MFRFGKFSPPEDYKCKKVTREFCEDVPKVKDVFGTVETCVSIPKQVMNKKYKFNSTRFVHIKHFRFVRKEH